MKSKQLAIVRRKIEKHYDLYPNTINDTEALAEIKSLKRKAAKGNMDDMDEKLHAALQVGKEAITL